jgi:gamma-glutamyltranspeptidase/glutathione hydrolase
MTKLRSRVREVLSLAVAITVLLPPSPLLALEPSREHARSMTINRFGILATSQTLASQAGAAILERGGSAVDAAIAANAALGVIEPMMNGVGGDLFAMVYDAKANKLYGLNASGWWPE